MILDRALLAESFEQIFEGVDAGKSRQEIWDSLPDLNQETIEKLMQQFSPKWFKNCPVFSGLLSHNDGTQKRAITEVIAMAPEQQADVIERLKQYVTQFADRHEAHDSFAELITERVPGSDQAYADALMDCDVAKVPPHLAYPISWLNTDLLEPILDKYAATETRIGVVARKIKEAQRGQSG